jgi:glycine hydroxymethyltransferase
VKPGEKILAMSLPHGGHLTHGTKVSFSGKWFDAVHYGVDRTPRTSTTTRCETWPRAPAQDDHLRRLGDPAADRLRAFREIADEVGAILMVDAAHFIGLVAGKAIPSPVPYADVVTFTTHKVLRGPRGA